MLCRIYAAVEFDREIDPDRHYIVPGGYEAVFDDGRALAFDFEDYEGGVSRENPKVLEWVQKNPDTDSFKDIEKFTCEDFEKHFDCFGEFFLYTGEADDPEITPVRPLYIALEFFKDGEFRIFHVPKDKFPTFETEKEEQRE